MRHCACPGLEGLGWRKADRVSGSSLAAGPSRGEQQISRDWGIEQTRNGIKITYPIRSLACACPCRSSSLAARSRFLTTGPGASPLDHLVPSGQTAEGSPHLLRTSRRPSGSRTQTSAFPSPPLARVILGPPLARVTSVPRRRGWIPARRRRGRPLIRPCCGRLLQRRRREPPLSQCHRRKPSLAQH
jgi:hypothetical protein